VVPWLAKALEGVAVVAGFGGAAVFLLSPLFADPTRTVIDPFAHGGPGWIGLPDMHLIMWVMSWDWHALTTAPLRLFDANVFHPAPSALASSEHMLGHLPIFGVIYGVSGNPVLANQLNVLLSISLCGASMYALLRHWGVSRTGALFGGFVYAFCPARVQGRWGIVHAHLLAGQYLPLALLFLDRTLVEARVRLAAVFALCLAAQLLCSYYLAYMTITALMGYGLGVLWSARGRLRGRGLVLAGVAALIPIALLAVLSVPYVRLKRLGIIADYQQLAFLRVASTDVWRNYLYPPIALREWHWALRSGTPVYVGMLPLGLALLSLISQWRAPNAAWARWAVPAAVGTTLACYVMGLGPQVDVGGWSIAMPYKAALRLVPGFSSMRVPSRFGLVFMAGFAALAGMGADRAITTMSGRRRWPALAMVVVLVCGTAYEYDLFRDWYAVRRVDTGRAAPPVYRTLAAAPAGPLLEIPAGGLAGEILGRAAESEYMLHSTSHWHPLLNGYSAYPPPSYAPLMNLARALPDARALSLLIRATGLRYVLVHGGRLRPVQRSRWIHPPGLRLLERAGTDLLFEVESPAPPDLMAALLDFEPRSTTILGHALAALPSTARRASLRLAEPAPVRAVTRMSFDVEFEVTNSSDSVWPSLVSVGRHNVTLAYRWEDRDGRVMAQNAVAGRLPYDLGPGESVRGAIHVHVPGPPGMLRLVIGLAQDGRWFPDTLPAIPVNVVPLPSR
jgi:hypothetical protein